VKNQTTTDGIIGFDDVGQGPAVVLLHGFPLCRLMWRKQAEDLHDRWRIIAPDLRGFGDSRGFDGTPSVDQMADDVAHLLDDLKVDRAVVGGLSMGGYVSLAFARRHASRLRGLVLADTKAEPDDEAARANRDRLIAFAATSTGVAVLEQMLPKLVSTETMANRPEVLDELRALAGAQVARGLVAALQALRDRPDARPGLAAIAVPTLVVVGRDDTLTPPAQSEALAAAIRDARLVVIDRAGHMSNLEQPTRFTAAVRAFLQELAWA
jgi:pimeloyl-ACP methyl ester carboxylesterase